MKHKIYYLITLMIIFSFGFFSVGDPEENKIKRIKGANAAELVRFLYRLAESKRIGDESTLRIIDLRCILNRPDNSHCTLVDRNYHQSIVTTTGDVVENFALPILHEKIGLPVKKHSNTIEITAKKISCSWYSLTFKADIDATCSIEY